MEKRYFVGDWLVRPELRRVEKNGNTTQLEPKVMEVLLCLIEAQGSLVSREQLIRRVWPDTFVSDDVVKRSIWQLRRAFDDNPKSPKVIETIAKGGYRLLLPVREAGAEDNFNVEVVTSRHTPVASPGSRPVQRFVLARLSWKLKAAIGLTSLGILALLLFPANHKNSRLLTRARMWMTQVDARESSATRPVVRQRRLTANPNDMPLTGGILSPDGKYLTYSDPSGFYLRQVDTGETHRLALPAGFDPLPESWFPDSVHLAVTSFGDKRIPFAPGVPRTYAAGAASVWMISIIGGTPRILAERGSSAQVSPDGSTIAFLAGRWDDEEIWLMQADGSGAKKIVDGGRDEFGAVAWTPDANGFACVRLIRNSGAERPPKQIEFYDSPTGRSHVILSDPRLGDHIAWLSSERLLYSLEEPEPNQLDFNLWSVTLDRRTGLPSAVPTRISNDHGDIVGISVAASSKRVALRRRTTQADAYLAQINQQSRGLGTPHRFTLDERADWPNAWTPDSKSLVFASDRDGPFKIYKQNIEETQPELLISGDDSPIVRWPRLASDGLNVLYGLGSKPGESSDLVRLMRTPIAGGPAQPVLEDSGIRNFMCAAFPSTLCIFDQIESKSAYHRFFMFSPSGAKGKELLAGAIKNEEGMNFWTLSPDGKHIVTTKSQNPNDDPALRIFDLATGNAHDIPVPEAGLIMGMDWAADSKSVWVGAYMGRGAWGTRSGILNVDLTGKIRVAYRGVNPEIWYAIPSPDGRQLALGCLSQASNMWLLENF